MNKNENTGNQEVIERLKAAQELYVLISGCTGAPYVVCNEETYDDEIKMYLEAEEAHREAKMLTEGGIPVNIAKLESRQFLLFYTSLYTMGVNALLVEEGEKEYLIQLASFVKRLKPDQGPEGKVWVENPALHLTALYYMQELRRKPGQENSPQLREWQDEITSHFGKGSFIVPVQKEGDGLVAMKLKDGGVYQAIFTDILEFQKFNREDKLRPLVVTADKIPQLMAAAAKGVVLNPMEVRMPLQIRKQNIER